MDVNRQQTCPRRLVEFGPWSRGEGQDAWNDGAVGAACSFCGSLHPDRFMELVREGWIIGPTDKDYKAYLGKPLTGEERERRKAEWVASMSPLGTEDSAALADMWEREHAFPSCGQEAKFYFQHLSEDQCGEFIDLHNAKSLRLGYPGYFYVRPFFCGSPAAAG